VREWDSEEEEQREGLLNPIGERGRRVERRTREKVYLILSTDWLAREAGKWKGETKKEGLLYFFPRLSGETGGNVNTRNREKGSLNLIHRLVGERGGRALTA
jgi:hypothetical protein